MGRSWSCGLNSVEFLHVFPCSFIFLLLLLLGCDKTMAKFHCWFPGCHPLWYSGNPCSQGIHLSNFKVFHPSCVLSFVHHERTPPAVIRNGPNLLDCSLCKTVACQQLLLGNQQVWLKLFPSAGVCITILFFFKEGKKCISLHTCTAF